MKRHFVAGTAYSKRMRTAGDEVERSIENAIMNDPTAGAVIPGTGGFRKLRVSDPGRGKGARGGLRVIYFDLPALERTYLMLIYDKGQKDDLSADEKRALRTIGAELIKENLK